MLSFSQPQSLPRLVSVTLNTSKSERLKCLLHPYISQLLILDRDAGEPAPYPRDSEGEHPGQDASASQGEHSHFEQFRDVSCMSLNCGRKPACLEESRQTWGEHANGTRRAGEGFQPTAVEMRPLCCLPLYVLYYIHKGYGNIAPKTARGRIFCVIYGLFGIPLCLTWISELGKFFGSRARRFGEFLIRKGLTLRKAQFTCTAIFLLWGLVVHLLIPPFVYMYYEGWSYVEGFYFSFVTLTTIGFGDLVTAVDPNAGYPVLYCFFVQLWICLGLAWLSLFFNWNVHMVVEAHKALKKRRRRHLEGPQQHEKVEAKPVPPNAVDIFSFLSEKHEGYSDHIKHIGEEKSRDNAIGTVLIRSKSCSDNIGGMRILTYDRSLRRKRRHSFSEHLSEAYARRMSQVHSDVGISQDSVSIQLNIEASEEGGTIWATKENQPLLSEEDGICPVTEENLLNSGDESGTRDSTAEEKAGAESSAAEERSSGSEDLDFDLVNSIYYSSREQLVKDEDNG
ncbi:uncharacterized protein LOC125714703 isoform X1 [Brienomyrus brachyistius]|uniref:uncharacterized protein LOC125714703 isoform X1 n=1 Tax=Brienomyrus brachyistius TaxID=42636 RepID=UPI0020B3FE55|nr:uncharacterized protein LOC125714703 isoform X1 [Brienomyrus brachyistius]